MAGSKKRRCSPLSPPSELRSARRTFFFSFFFSLLQRAGRNANEGPGPPDMPVSGSPFFSPSTNPIVGNRMTGNHPPEPRKNQGPFFSFPLFLPPGKHYQRFGKEPGWDMDFAQPRPDLFPLSFSYCAQKREYLALPLNSQPFAGLSLFSPPFPFFFSKNSFVVRISRQSFESLQRPILLFPSHGRFPAWLGHQSSFSPPPPPPRRDGEEGCCAK